MGKNATPHEIIARAEERRREEARQIIDSKRREYMRDELGLSDEKIEKIIGNEPASWVIDAVAEARADADELEQQLAAAQAELALVRELPAKWRAAPQDPNEPLLAMAADELDAAIDAAMEGEKGQ